MSELNRSRTTLIRVPGSEYSGVGALPLASARREISAHCALSRSTSRASSSSDDALGGGADDDTGVLGHDPVEDGLEPLALGVRQLAGDAGGPAARHVHEEPAGQGDLSGQPGALVPDRILGHLRQDRVPAGQRGLDAPGLAAEAGGVPVDLAGVDHGVAAATDVDERRLHRRQHVLHLAQEDAADQRVGPGLGHEVLDQDAVLQQRDLREVTPLPHRHHPLDGFPAGQEFGLGEDLRTAAGRIAGVAPPLPLGLQPGGTADPLHLVRGRRGRRRRGRAAGLADVHDGVVRVVLAGGGVVRGCPATTAPPAPGATGGGPLVGGRVGRFLFFGVVGLGALVNRLGRPS